jgi:predicted DsbA family dithiol-disulfide isomerase
VRWTAFPLHPETPEEGRTLEDLFAGRPVDVPAMLAHLRRTAAQLGLPFGERRMTFNSRRAQELGKWAESAGRGREFHQAVFKAYFAQGLNIARRPVLRQIVESVGLPGDDALAALDAGDYRQAVDRDWQRTRTMGITAVPTFDLDGRQLVGAQTYAALADLVRPPAAEALRTDEST